MGIRLVPKSVTLIHLERRNGRLVLRYFAEFGSFWGQLYVKVVEDTPIPPASEM